MASASGSSGTGDSFLQAGGFAARPVRVVPGRVPHLTRTRGRATTISVSVPNLKAPSGNARGHSAALFLRTASACVAAALSLALLSCQARPGAEAGSTPPTAPSVAGPASGVPEGAPPAPQALPERAAPDVAAARAPAPKPAPPPAPFSERLLAERPFGARLPKDFAIGGLASAADPRGALPAARTFLGTIASRRAEGFPVDPAWERTFALLHAQDIQALPDGLGFRVAEAVEGGDGSMTHAFALIGPAGRSEGSARFYKEGETWRLAGLEVDLSPGAFARAAAGEPFDPERYDWPD